MGAHRMARAFAGFVGFGSVLWWILLFSKREWAEPFLWKGASADVFFAFVPADFGIFIPAAILFAAKGWRGAWLVFLGAAAYGSLVTLGLCVLLGGGRLGLWLMIALMAGALYLEWRMRAESPRPND